MLPTHEVITVLNYLYPFHHMFTSSMTGLDCHHQHHHYIFLNIIIWKLPELFILITVYKLGHRNLITVAPYIWLFIMVFLSITQSQHITIIELVWFSYIWLILHRLQWLKLFGYFIILVQIFTDGKILNYH